MSPPFSDTPPLEDPTSNLERAFIEQFIRARGHDPARVHELPGEQAKLLLKEASAYAAAKLAEVESRAHFIDELHGEG